MIIHVLLVLPISLLLFSDYPCSTRSTHSSTSFQWLSMFYSFYPYLYCFQWLSMFYSSYPYLYFFSVIIHVLLVLPIALLLFSDYPCSTRSTHISTSFQWLSMFYVRSSTSFQYYPCSTRSTHVSTVFSDYPCSTRSTHSSTSFQWLSMFYSFYP